MYASVYILVKGTKYSDCAYPNVSDKSGTNFSTKYFNVNIHIYRLSRISLLNLVLKCYPIFSSVIYIERDLLFKEIRKLY